MYSPTRKTKNIINNSSGLTLTPAFQEDHDKLAIPPVFNSAMTQSLNFDVNRKDFDSTFMVFPEENITIRKGSYIDREIRKVENESASPIRKGSYIDREVRKVED